MRGLERKDFEEHIINNASWHEDYELEESKVAIMPFFDKDSREVKRSAFAMYTLKHELKESHKHTVVVAYTNKKFYAWCGDAFLNAGKSRSKADAMAAAELVSKNTAEQTEILKQYGSKKDKGCRFWAAKTCSHVDMVYALIQRDMKVLDQLEEMLDPSAKSETDRSPVQVMEKLMFKKHVMLRGPKGSGKTYLAQQLSKKIGADVFFYGGHEKTESCDFIGEYIPTTVKESIGGKSLFDGGEVSHLSMVWKDGPLSKAIRNAASGKKSVLIIDEVLRIPREELSPLISALSPSDEGKFVLNTKRAVDVKDDLAIEEVLSCPKENLWIITTTNIGSQYSVSKVDEAFADRMRMIQMDTDLEAMKVILKKLAKKLKYRVATVNKMLKFYEVFTRRFEDGGFTKIINQRHLVEALECAIDEDDVKETLWETRLAWVDDDYDGNPRVEQVKEIRKILDKVFE